MDLYAASWLQSFLCFDRDVSLQIVVITMIALALSEDSISKRGQRDVIIESLARLPENTRKVRHVCVRRRHDRCAPFVPCVTQPHLER